MIICRADRRGYVALAVTAFLLSFLFAAACGEKESTPTAADAPLASKIVATVNGEPITLDDFATKWSTLPDPVKKLYAGEAGKREFLDELISRQLLLQEARSKNLDRNADLQEKVQLYKERLLLDDIIKSEIDGRVAIELDELKRYFEENRSSFSAFEEVQVSHILVKTEKEAKDIRTQILRGANFSELAERHSLDPATRERGGSLGAVKFDELIPDFQTAVAKLKPGEISSVLSTSFGFHVIRLGGRRTVQPTSLSAVRQEVEKRLRQEKQKQLFDEWLLQLRASAEITISDGLLATVPKPAPDSGQAPPPGR